MTFAAPFERPDLPAQQAGAAGVLGDGLFGGDGTATEDLELAARGAFERPPEPPPVAEAPAGAPVRRARGRSVPSARPHRGRVIGAAPSDGRQGDVAWDAVLRQAAPQQAGRRGPEGRALVLRADDLRQRRRVIRPGHRLLLVVDVSGSMGVATMGLAKTIVADRLRDAYVRREQVAMIACRGREAALVFDFTNQPELVQRALAALPCGGTTPLPAALELAHCAVARLRRREPDASVELMVLSDGQANVGRRPGAAAVAAELRAVARALAALANLDIHHLDTTEADKPDAAARQLAHDLQARRWEVARLPTAALLAALAPGASGVDERTNARRSGP